MREVEVIRRKGGREEKGREGGGENAADDDCDQSFEYRSWAACWSGVEWSGVE
jgi:hypothetical protein